MTIQVDRYNNWQGQGRVTLREPNGRSNTLTLQEAQTLRDELDAALRDMNEVDVMFEPECRAATHGGRSSNCICEDSRDE